MKFKSNPLLLNPNIELKIRVFHHLTVIYTSVKHGSMKKIILITLLFLIVLSSYSQRQADRWYFGRSCGLNFTSGEPVVDNNGLIDGHSGGCGTMCDSLGNLLLYNGVSPIYNSIHEIMENSEDLQEWGSGLQNGLIVPWPESDSLYFVFKTTSINIPGAATSIFYNVVDMSLNNGLGAVIEKDVRLQNSSDIDELFTATYHKNKRDIWIISRDIRDDRFMAFLITPDGIDTNPVYSPAPHVGEIEQQFSYMKLSYDKKYLFTLFAGFHKKIEICTFNSETGEVEYLYNHENDYYSPGDMEFSPDSKFVYISYVDEMSVIVIRQYEMQYIDDAMLFSQSAVNVVSGNKGRGLQLATDGKIYYMTDWENSPGTPSNSIVGSINKPWLKGTACECQNNAVSVAPGETSEAMPVILMDYLYRFDYDGVCAGEPIQFKSFFNPEPASIEWSFDDIASGSNNTSNEINPVHIFSTDGLYEVEVDVWYPSGRFEHTSRIVEIENAPNPDLGPDTSICYNADITLDAECGPHFYSWSTGNFGTSHVTVSDTGWYWVEVTSDGGCFAYDSIHISKFPESSVDSANLIISPTTCGGSTGSVRGLAIAGVPPYTYNWIDDLGDTIATSLDMYHLQVGNYTLQVTDGNNCVTEFGPYSIIDVGDVLVESVAFTHEHCNQMDGAINITATSGLGDMLYYSIDNGANYFKNMGDFNGLSSGAYAVRVQDSSLCEDAYINNPVIINTIGGPEITDVQITPESSGMSDGQISITAVSASDTIFYSNDNGATIQINNGLFTGLSAGFYTCVVSDKYGCDTTFIVEVQEDITIKLEAIAGEDGVCPGNVAYVPLYVTNFNDVSSFTATLLFNPDKLLCQGYMNAHTLLEDSLKVFLFPAEGKVELRWDDPSVTLPANSKLADIIFDASDSGSSSIEWDGATGANVFYNSSGNQIPVIYQMGEVIIFKEVYFSITTSEKVCKGDSVILTPDLISGNGQVNYLWIFPDGTTNNNESVLLNDIQFADAGEYRLKATDTAGCYQETGIDVTVNDIPLPQFALYDTIFTEDPIDLDAGAGFMHYWWNTGDTTQTVRAENEGWYVAEVESQQGCVGIDSSYVVFKTTNELINVYFPNAFTPNGDGENDEFKVVTPSANIAVFSLSIFNRWGAQIFHTSDITQGWDGTYKGSDCPMESYVFKVSYNTSVQSNALVESRMGTVMLIR